MQHSASGKSQPRVKFNGLKVISSTWLNRFPLASFALFREVVEEGEKKVDFSDRFLSITTYTLELGKTYSLIHSKHNFL